MVNLIIDSQYIIKSNNILYNLGIYKIDTTYSILVYQNNEKYANYDTAYVGALIIIL